VPAHFCRFIDGTTKRQVAAMFAEEKPALLPLPLGVFNLIPTHTLDLLISAGVI